MAKASKSRFCVLHCELPIEVSRDWNSLRTENGYSSETFADLASRFESPDTKNRWDTPLFRVDPRADNLEPQLDAAIATITGNIVMSSSQCPPLLS